MTTRGLKEEHMVRIAEWMTAAVEARDDEAGLVELREQVRQLLADFPVFKV
jgi:glycine hydroxymethyltransferase